MPARGFASHFPRGSGNHLFAPWRQKRSPDYGAVVLIEDQRRINWLTSGVAAQVQLSPSLGEGNQNLPKQVLTHVALCGLEHRQQTTRFLIGSPEEYVHGHTLSIMLTQKRDTSKLVACEPVRPDCNGGIWQCRGAPGGQSGGDVVKCEFSQGSQLPSRARAKADAEQAARVHS